MSPSGTREATAASLPPSEAMYRKLGPFHCGIPGKKKREGELGPLRLASDTTGIDIYVYLLPNITYLSPHVPPL